MLRRLTTFLALTVAVLMCRFAVAQKATVTFCSPPEKIAHQALDAVAVDGSMPFFGNLFDGDHRLAHLSRGNFVSFELPAGQHVFSGTTKDHASKQYTLTLDVKTGGQYFVRLMSKSHSAIVVPVLFVEPQLESVACSTAVNENARSQPLEAKHVSKDAQALVVRAANSLSCP
jgi:hypothetical protein